LLLLRLWHQPHDLGHVASAYNRIDDIAWLATKDFIDPHDDFSTELLDVQVGLYVVGKIAGYSEDELRSRGVAVDDVRERIASDEAQAIASRGRGNLDRSDRTH
jgi:hypothetical protein